MKSNLDLAWASGIFEGEGCFWVSKRTSKDRYNPNYVAKIEVRMTDKKCMKRLQSIFKIGTVKEISNGEKATRNIFTWQVGKTEHVLKICKMILPYVSNGEKKPQIEAIIEFINKKPKREFWFYSGRNSFKPWLKKDLILGEKYYQLLKNLKRPNIYNTKVVT